nr:MAG TPA: protein of unknown function (UPF0137) [Caudoviricetes sp.]
MENIENVTGDVLDLNNQFASYQDYKAAVDTEMNRAAESFVRIGYLLKIARDTDILKESGYANVNEFAESIYHLDKSQVSRFININDTFAENGYSDRLQTQYQGYGYAKLAVMLTLPEEIREEIPASYSKREIETIQDEYKEEQKVSDIEVMLEGEKEAQKTLNLLGKTLDQVIHDYPDMAAVLYSIKGYQEERKKKYYEALAPSGEVTYTARIQGIGRLAMVIKGATTDITILNMRSLEKEYYSWDQLTEAIQEVICPDMSIGEPVEKWWERHYGETFPAKKEEIAPVQPQKPHKDSVKKPSRVITPPPKKEKPHEEKKEPEKLPVQESKPETVSEPVPEEFTEPIEPMEQESEDQEEAAVSGNEMPVCDSDEHIEAEAEPGSAGCDAWRDAALLKVKEIQNGYKELDIWEWDKELPTLDQIDAAYGKALEMYNLLFELRGIVKNGEVCN